MNNAAGLLFAFLAMLMSCVSLEKVLLQLVKKKREHSGLPISSSTGTVVVLWDAAGRHEVLLNKTQWPDTLLLKGAISPPQLHPDPHVRWAEVAHLATLAASYTFSAQLYSLYLNIPVIGEGGTTFLFVFLKNPSSGLLK